MPRILKTPGTDVVQAVMHAYERGRVVDALRAAESFAPLDQWTGVRESILASRIAANAGAPGLARKLAVRARRLAPHDPEALTQYSYEVSGHRGPLAVWELLRNVSVDSTAADEVRAELLAAKARAASDLRDFAVAEQLLNAAETMDPSRPWIRLQRAHLLERLDRIEEALAVARDARSLHKHPFHRPSVQSEAHLLQLLDRDKEAIELLKAADAVVQSGPIAVQLFSLLHESRRWAEAESALERYVELSPLLSAESLKWVTSQRARVAYHLGRRDDAARLAGELEDDFHRGFARRLADAPAIPDRTELNVTFVRQHFKTCAPATLAALARFWEMPSEHVQIAEAVCYDGTPHWQQRQWAEANGWFVRNFRVTDDIIPELIRRGVPFAVSVVDATSAHMMAVIGFDRIRRTLLLRDPGQPYAIEFDSDAFLKRYGPFGPFGSVFLPVAEKHRIDGVALPQADAYDCHYLFSLALDRHARAEAVEQLAALEACFSSIESGASADDTLLWDARLDLAYYDANTTEQLRCLDQLLTKHPQNAARQLRRYGCMGHASRRERIEFLREAGALKDADPALLVEYARLLQEDARRRPQAKCLLKRAMRCRPYDSYALRTRADLYWEEGMFPEATEVYRFAATLEGYREPLYRSWFVACRRTRRTDEALALLRDRFERFGSRSEQPALTLAWALTQLEQPAAARDVLKAAARLRPNDGQLLLRSASIVAGLKDVSEAEQLLSAARGRVRENDWLRTAAEVAEMRKDFEGALELLQSVLRLEPLAIDAHETVARLLARMQGPAAAVAHLKAACERFPHHHALRRTLAEWCQDDLETAEASVRELIARDPADAWARRELAFVLSRRKRFAESLAEAEEGARIEPRNTYSFSTLGFARQNLGQLAEARPAFRRAVELSVDNTNALTGLLDLARDDSERREELAFIEKELIQQVVLGDGLLTFLDLARPILPPEQLLAQLRKAHAERPDLWHAWSALISQLGHLRDLANARDLAIAATQRFAHLPRVWLDLARVHHWRNEQQEEINAAESAFECNPGWPAACLALTDALERAGRLADSNRIFERAITHCPTDAQLRACHAHLLWRMRQPEDAFNTLEKALHLAPGYEWAWSLLGEWGTNHGDAERPVRLARKMSAEMPGNVRVWLMLARMAQQAAAREEAFAALDKALELDPRRTEAWEAKAEFLAVNERFDEAVETCVAGLQVCHVDLQLLHGRRAWIEAQRRQLAEAIRLMQQVLKDNASYAWGWGQIAHWQSQQGDLPAATESLETLQRLHPHDAWTSRQLGFLRLQQKDTNGATEAFARALQLSPTDVSAAHNLFDLQMQASDLRAAAATLLVMQIHQPGASTIACEIRLQLRDNDRSGSAKSLEKLCRTLDPNPWALDDATEQFRRFGRSDRALKVLRQTLKSGPCNPQAGAAAVRLLLSQRKDWKAAWLFLQLKDPEMQRRAAAEIGRGLAETQSGLVFRWVHQRRRAVFAADDHAWGQAGFALLRLRRMKAAVKWMSDWRERKEVQAWMLFNVCVGLRYLGDYQAATEVASYALKAWGHRENVEQLDLFLGVEAALTGSLEEARMHLKRATVRDSGHDQELLCIAKAMVEFRELTPEHRQEGFRRIRGQLAERFSSWQLLQSMRDVRRTFRRAGLIMAQDGGGWRARLWFGWQLHWQWTFVPFLLPVVLAAAYHAPILIGVAAYGIYWKRNRSM